MSAIVERIVSEWRDKEPTLLDVFSRDELASFARAALRSVRPEDVDALAVGAFKNASNCSPPSGTRCRKQPASDLN